MHFTEEEISIKLKDKIILLVEDDDDLITRLLPEFQRFGIQKPVVARWAEAGFKELCDNANSYNLIIVDVMLTETENNYNQIQSCKKELKTFRKLWADVGTPVEKNRDFNEKLQVARDKRPILIGEIEAMTIKDGGIDMLEKWLSKCTKNGIKDSGVSKDRRSGDDSKDMKVCEIPIIYLTALGEESRDIKERGESIAKYSEWIVKPVAAEVLLEAIIQLIEKVQFE